MYMYILMYFHELLIFISGYTSTMYSTCNVDAATLMVNFKMNIDWPVSFLSGAYLITMSSPPRKSAFRAPPSRVTTERKSPAPSTERVPKEKCFQCQRATQESYRRRVVKDLSWRGKSSRDVSRDWSKTLILRIKMVLNPQSGSSSVEESYRR